jgi:choline-sulfatase
VRYNLHKRKPFDNLKTKPNILLIMTDQHDPAIAGFAGNEIVDTRNLDALAARSVQFDSAVTPSPLCTPSRMCMLTGKEAHNCSAWSNHWVIFPEHTTWPAHFAANGYRTCLVGKMHFGGKDQMQGFQDRPYGDLRHGTGHQPDPLSMFPGYGAARGAGATELPESLLQDVVVTRETLSYVLEHEAGENPSPWFVCASYSRPHPPLTAPGRYISRYRNRVPPPEQGGEPSEEPYAKQRASGHLDLTKEEIRQGREGYYACLDFVDDCIGDLLSGLEAAGALENTIVIYTSDHGEMLGNHGIWGKSVYFDRAVRVPLLISGPGIAESGGRLSHPVSLIDLFPTTCSLAGIPTPSGLDGKDLSDVLASPESAPSSREAVFSMYCHYGQLIQSVKTLSGDEPHRAWRMARTVQWKCVEIEGGATLLFNLEEDPEENCNLSEEPEYADRLAHLRGLIYENFSWAEVHDRMKEGRKRLSEYRSGRFPTTPNQYRFKDGREFDAEASLYDARWLPIQPGSNGGIIPQQFG